MNIRPAREKDLPILLGFEQEIVDIERPFDNTLKEGEIHYYDLPQLISSLDSKVVVAEIENEIVGSGYAVIKEADSFLKHKEYAYLGLMYTKPSHRGKGINQAILKTLKEWIISKEITEIRMVVYDENMVAKKAYQKSGFKAHVLEMRMEI